MASAQSNGKDPPPRVVSETRSPASTTYVLALAVVAGVLGGLGAVAFRYLTEGVQYIFFSSLLPHISLYVWRVNLGMIILPAIGAAVIAPAIYHLAPETRGGGIPETIEAYTLGHGQIRARVAILKLVLSALTIGSGGSAGREGPLAQVGGACGSVLGRTFELSERQVKLLVVSGVAAGIAGTYNAPLGGALFSIEVLQRSFSWRSTPPVIIASVVGTVVAGLFFGLQPALTIPSSSSISSAIAMITAPQLSIYVLLGLVLGVLSFAWTRMFYAFQAAFERLSIPGTAKLAVGGLAVGAIGVVLPTYGIFGPGVQGIELALAGGVTIGLAVALAGAKLLATSFTVGSSASGGIFAPTLYAGAMLGGAMGLVFAGLIPGAGSSTVGYSLAGMAALLGGATRAPLMAIVIIPEMTNEWGALPAIMTSCIISYYVAAHLMKHSSIYTMNLEKSRGLDIQRLSVPDYLGLVEVGEVAVRVPAVGEWETVAATLRPAQGDPRPREGGRGIPVVDAENRLVGSLSTAQMESIPEAKASVTPVNAIMDRDLTIVTVHESVRDAIQRMNNNGVTEAFVVEDETDEDGMIYLGVITSSREVLKARELGIDRTDE